MAAGAQAAPQGLLAAARSLAVDSFTRDIVEGLEHAGLEYILLKGPALASWLYERAPRDYGDADLLVDPQHFEVARRLLASWGFVQLFEEPQRRSDLPHAEPWGRAHDDAEVDLHRTLFGLGVAPEDAWRELAATTESLREGGTEFRVLSPPARALVVAVHAAQHGPDTDKPLDDLSRALERVPEEIWAEAAVLAARLDATQTFATGLRLLPDGARLADRLELVRPTLIAAAHRARLALGFERLAGTPGPRAKLELALREAFPKPAYLRWWSPLARRGRLGLALTYVWRPLWLLGHAGPSFIAWRRTRKNGTH
jgi:hypothetical protein